MSEVYSLKTFDASIASSVILHQINTLLCLICPCNIQTRFSDLSAQVIYLHVEVVADVSFLSNTNAQVINNNNEQIKQVTYSLHTFCLFTFLTIM